MNISEIDVITPRDVDECLNFLHLGEEMMILAGGTDAVVRMKEGKWRPKTWINIKHLHELRFIRKENNEIHIGPLTTHTDIVQSHFMQNHADVLVQAAREVGATQMQNMGTLGGNIQTASPAGDTIPALYVLGASIELRSQEGKRTIPIEEFYLGPGKTLKRHNEMITKIIIHPQEKNEIGIFEKLGPRKAQSISIVNMACSLHMSANRKCLGGKIAFGSVGPTIIRARKCEALLTMGELDIDMIENIAKVAWKEVMPITDVRASAEYRRDMASALLQRGLLRLMKRWDKR